jgi:hypothetical protein
MSILNAQMQDPPCLSANQPNNPSEQAGQRDFSHLSGRQNTAA